MTTKQNEIHICRSFAYLFIICIRERLVSDQGILRTLVKECYVYPTYYLSTYCTFNEYVVPRNRRSFAFSYKIQVKYEKQMIWTSKILFIFNRIIFCDGEMVNFLLFESLEYLRIFLNHFLHFVCGISYVYVFLSHRT